MAQAILVVGFTGTGKTTSLRNLDNDKTIIIQCEKKELPWRGSSLDYPMNEKALYRNNWDAVKKTLLKINAGKRITTIVIDDVQYLMTNELMGRAQETGFKKFTEVALHFKQLRDLVRELRDDLMVVYLSHSEFDDDGRELMKTSGKLVRKELDPEGSFTVVLFTFVSENGYKFRTNNTGDSCAKTPMGMFSEKLIDNDINQIIPIVQGYYKNKPKKKEEKVDGK